LPLHLDGGHRRVSRGRWCIDRLRGVIGYLSWSVGMMKQIFCTRHRP